MLPLFFPRRRPRREYEHDYDYDRSYSRDHRDERLVIERSARRDEPRGYPPPAALPSAATTTKTTYEVGRDRNSEAYVKRSNALTIGPENGRSEFEVIRPQRRDDGAYVIDLGSARGYDDRNDYAPRARYYDLPPASRSRRDEDVIMYESSRTPGRDRAISHASYKDVQVMEDIDDDPRYRRRGREPEIVPEEIAPPPARLRSSMRGRNESPPEEWQRRRTHSVGFFKDQISYHDASEGRHERPGAEAHLAGKYLHSHRDDDEERSRVSLRARSRSRGGYGPRRSDPRLREYDYEDDRGAYTEETMRDYEYEDDSRRRYPPQRDSSRHRRHHRQHGHEDDRSSYSEYETKTKKTYYK